MKSFRYSVLMLICSYSLFTSCKKNESNTTAAKSFDNVSFDAVHAYFSTSGSTTTPMDSNQAKSAVTTIDLVFILNWDYDEPGFMDPVTLSQHWYWDDYYAPFLSQAMSTALYSTTVTKAQFDESRNDQTKIATYFSSAVPAPHAIFPEGTCIGGRQSSYPESILLAEGAVYGFKILSTGKRGFIYVRTDQPNLWPSPIFSSVTKVDIIREN